MPATSRATAGRTALRQLVRTSFGGSPSVLSSTQSTAACCGGAPRRHSVSRVPPPAPIATRARASRGGAPPRRASAASAGAWPAPRRRRRPADRRPSTGAPKTPRGTDGGESSAEHTAGRTSSSTGILRRFDDAICDSSGILWPAPLQNRRTAGLRRMEPTTEVRVLACLHGIATGDAVGKQTEHLSREDVLRWYPDGVHGFQGPLGTPIPRYRGNKKHEWLVGETTDDTERTLAVAHAIIRDGAVTHASVGRELLKCRKCVHPGVRSLWEFHESGDPARIAREHDGCGAAVRIAPVGILYRPERLTDLVAAAREASISTHGGALALAAAAAVAAAVSAAVDGLSAVEIVDVAHRAAVMAEREHTDPPTTRFAEALEGLFQELTRWRALHPATLAAHYFPNNPLTIVPLALALAAITDSAQVAILLATNTGGDSDSVASIAGGIAGARYPDSVRAEWSAAVHAVNGHNLVSVAEALTALRR
jgi:ADP-ribosylglycohydrolase